MTNNSDSSFTSTFSLYTPWEYKVEEMRTIDSDLLNYWGKEGWELIKIVERQHDWACVFKRSPWSWSGDNSKWTWQYPTYESEE